MKITGYVNYGEDYNGVNIEAESVEEFRAAFEQLVKAAPAHFENIVQVQQAAIAAEVLKPEKKAVEKATPVERTKSTAPPKGKKADKDGCRHGPWTVFEEGVYKHTHYCDGPKDDKCSFQELKDAGIR